jgi:hypothetical protein
MPKRNPMLALIALAAFAGSAAAQQYPVKPITLMVPYAPGPTDTVARIMALAMTKPIGTSFVVENRPSNGGILAPELVAKAAPDGYTILIHHIGMATTPALYRQLRFKPLEDFEYIGLINEVPMTLIGRANLPPGNLKELLAYIKANKEKMSLANAGIGAASHLSGMLFQSAIQVDLLTVPYKGTGPAMNDLLGGQVDFMCDQTTSTTAQIKAGKVKVYGVTTGFGKTCAPLGGYHSFTTLADVASIYDSPIGTGENLFSTQDIENLVRFGGMRPDRDIIQIDVPQSYGIVQFARTLDMLKRHKWQRKSIFPHGGNQMTLAIVGGFGLGGCEAYPDVFGVFAGFADDAKVENGYLRLPDRPGIGFEAQDALYGIMRAMTAE